MILRYSVENYRSFRDRAEVSFVATRLRDEPAYVLPRDATPFGVLPVVGVYGANASGKSNLVTALQAHLDHVRYSFVQLRPGGRIPWAPFRLRTGEGAPPTRFEVDFLVDGVRHHYGFAYTAAEFVEEWLYRWPRGHRQLLFHRAPEADGGWRFGRELTGVRAVIRDATRDNALFLSAAAQFNHELLRPVGTALGGASGRANEVPFDAVPLFPPGAAILDPRFREVVQGLLAAADLGVTGLRPQAVRDLDPSSAENLRRGMTAEDHGRLVVAQGQDLAPSALWLSRGRGGERWELSPSEESAGTSVLLARLDDVLAALAAGRLLVLDELDASLSSALCTALIGLFTHPDTNPRGAQLLFTSHDGALVRALRRDEVVLVDKDAEGNSTARPASDYAGVRGREDLRRVLEEGRIGGVPVLGDFHAIVARGLGRGA